MLTTRRLHGNFAREEFRAVALMSWLHLAVLFNSPVVTDLRAEASSPELRLLKIAERVGVKAHPQSQALFLLAQPASLLMTAIEQGLFNGPLGAQSLYLIPRVQRLMEVIINQYRTATGRDVKVRPVNSCPSDARSTARVGAAAPGAAAAARHAACRPPAAPAAADRRAARPQQHGAALIGAARRRRGSRTFGACEGRGWVEPPGVRTPIMYRFIFLVSLI